MSLDQTGLALGRFLSYVSHRQEVIASNIANADTPGYKTRDVAAPQTLSGTSFSGVLISGLPVRNDGNNVSIDREARLLAENTLKFNLATQMLRGEIKDIRSAIQEGRA
jgi:flagellar basal-body rod protein FlgB